MNAPEPTNIPAGAIDLSDVKKRADERDAVDKAAREQASYDAAVERARSWDRAMTRTFKGIVSAPVRRRNIALAAARQEADRG